MVNVSSEAARWKRGGQRGGAGVADGVTADLMDLMTCAPGEPGSSASSIPERSHLCHPNLSDLGKKKQSQTQDDSESEFLCFCYLFGFSSLQPGLHSFVPIEPCREDSSVRFSQMVWVEGTCPAQPAAGRDIGTLGHWDIAPEPRAQRIDMNHTGSRELLKSEL